MSIEAKIKDNYSCKYRHSEHGILETHSQLLCQSIDDLRLKFDYSYHNIQNDKCYD